MLFKNILLLVCTALLAIGCASTPEPKPMTSEVEIKTSGQKGFSLSFPEQKEWTIIEESPYKIVFSKQSSKNNERYTIQALVVKLPSFKDDNDFLSFIEKSMNKNRDKSNLKVIEQQIEFASGQGDKCVRYNSKEELKVKSKKTKSLVLGMVNFTCRHPDKENTGIYIAYSKKSFSENMDENLLAQAENIFNGLTFSVF